MTDAIALYPGGSTSVESILWPLVTYESSSEAGGTSDGGVLGQTADTLLGASPSPIALEPTLDVVIRLDSSPSR